MALGRYLRFGVPGLIGQSSAFLKRKDLRRAADEALHPGQPRLAAEFSIGLPGVNSSRILNGG